MGSEKEYLQQLGALPFFEGCTKKELEQVASMVTPIELQAGATFITQGTSGKEMVIIATGSATVRRNGRKIATLGAGAVVGELALLTDQPRDSSVAVDVDSELLVLDRRSFVALLDSVPGLAKKLLFTMAKRMAENAKLH
jgi:CRP/FNR family transcriptional regulator, cyclic AMP receptor protein